jgi:hypothetical protein
MSPSLEPETGKTFTGSIRFFLLTVGRDSGQAITTRYVALRRREKSDSVIWRSHQRHTMLSSWSGILGLLSGLAVETGSPDALCPDVQSAEAAIGARVGELEGPADPYRVRYTIVHAPESAAGDFVRLQIFDSADELRLSRDLPLTAESCDTMAQAMALVVERFFRAMVGERAPVPEPSPDPAPEPPPKVEAPAAPSTIASPPALDQGVRERSRAKGPPAFLLAAQAGVLGPPLRPTFGSLFVVRAGASLSLASSLGFVLVPWTEELERGGQAHLQAGLLRLTPAWDFALASARVSIGPTLAIAAERAWTTGLPTSTPRYRATSAAGATLSFRIATGRVSALDVSALVETPFRPFGGEFVVDGEEVLEPPSVRSALALGWGAAWSR